MEGKFCFRKYLIWVVLLLGQLHGCKSCIEKERNALFELKKYVFSRTMEGYLDVTLPTWTNDTKSDCCRWEGIMCDRAIGRVTRIALGSLYITESYPLNLSLLHPFENLRSLNLSEFILSDLFDDVEGYKSLQRLRNLEILDLSLNRFNNSIFPFLNAATSLTTLFLRSNNMDGPFPVKALKDLTNLELLDLSSNNFNGLPVQGYKSLSRLKKLEILDLSFNEFNKSIFSFLNVATSLKILFLNRNYIDGALPELKDLTNLEQLDLSSNKFNGPIQELSALRKLKALNLSNNELSGSLGLQEICKLKNMQKLDLSRNNLVGQLPLCLTSLKKLRVLDLSSNQLTGELPSALGDLESLEYLSLFDNSFEGFFSLDWLANLSKLKLFRLESKSNSLQVESTSSWKPKFQLSVIALRSCNLEKFPHFLLHQKDLRHVDLSDNKISGDLPSFMAVREQYESRAFASTE